MSSLILMWILRAALALSFVVVSLNHTANGQIVIQGGSFNAQPSGAVQSAEIVQPAAQPKMNANQSKPKASSKPNKKEKKENDQEQNDKESKLNKPKSKEAKETIVRGNDPPGAPDPRELEASPDENGRVRFSFHGQPWPAVLQWLANVSDLSLDWRELPNDYLNLTTQRAYTLDEARDLINRHLQARGYTLLLSGEVLSVFKLDKIEPSLVPRVTEEDLYDLQPHDIVKLTFDLPAGLDPAKAVEDVKQALSPHAKAMPLAATKRILLIDTVINLRMVSSLLNAERLEVEGQVVPKEFVLNHVQASEIIDILYVVLGLDPNSRPSQMDLQIQQKKLEILQQMSQRGKDIAKMLQPDGPKVYLAYNKQRNSVLANAPPEQMAIIERTIKSLDVPSTDQASGSIADSGSSLRTLERYRLKEIKPDSLLNTLNEIGNLSPRAELRADNSSKILFARCTAADHAKIADLVEELDSTDFVVKVFQLRRYPADAVAGTIGAILIKPPEKKERNNSSYYWFGGRRQEEEEKPQTELRVDADTENNRLIARGTQQQIEEVTNLLIQLGEPIGTDGRQSNVRVLGTLGKEQTERLLKQLQEAWPSVGDGTELILPEIDEQNSSPDSRDSESRDTTASNDLKSTFRLLSHADKSQQDQQSDEQIKLSVDQRGRLIISGNNQTALNQLEELIVAMVPEPPRFKVFPVEHLRADYIVDMLEIYYEEEVNQGKGEDILDWWGRVRETGSKDEGPVRLSKRRRLRFLHEQTSNTVLVANAPSEMLKEIKTLIDSWDKPPIDDAVLSRQTEAIRIRYSKASKIAATIKEVYRDLLSRGDKEFDTKEEKARGGDRRLLTSIKFSDGSAYQSTKPIYIGFDGVLSVGADDTANVLVISASSEIFHSVVQMVRVLDEEARPREEIRVVELDGSVSAKAMKAALSRALRKQTAPENKKKK